MDEDYKPKANIFLQGFDVMDLVSFIGRLTKRYQANLLANMETILDKDSQEYKDMRKLILDSTNNFSRAIVKSIFGDIEF